MHKEQLDKFEKWLPTVCFQRPTPQAYELAWQAWKAAQQSVYLTAFRRGLVIGWGVTTALHTLFILLIGGR